MTMILQKQTEQLKSAFDDMRISAAYDPMLKLSLQKAEGAVGELLRAAADAIDEQAQKIEEQKRAIAHLVEHLAATLVPGDN